MGFCWKFCHRWCIRGFFDLLVFLKLLISNPIEWFLVHMFFRRERLLFLLVCPLRISLQLRGHGLLLVQTVGVGSRFGCRASLSEISFSYFVFRCWISMSRTSQNPFKSKSLLLSLIEVLARDLGIQSDSVCVFGFFKEIWCCLIHSTIWRLNCCFNCFVLTVDRFELLHPLTLWWVLFFIIR